MSSIATLWKLEDDVPFRGEYKLRVQQFKQSMNLAIVTRITPTHPTIPLRPSVALWMLQALQGAMIHQNRWRAATVAIIDDATGDSIGIMDVYDERHPPAPANPPSLTAGTNATSIEITIPDNTLLSSAERLQVISVFHHTQTLPQNKVFEAYHRGMLWMLQFRAQRALGRDAQKDDRWRVEILPIHAWIGITNVGDRRNGWLTWEQVADAWRGMLVEAVRNGEGQSYGYRAMAAAFVRVRGEGRDKRDVMVATRYEIKGTGPWGVG